MTEITGRKGEAEWLQTFLPLYEKARPLVQKVGKCVMSEDEKAAVEALKEAVEELPSILYAMKAAPNPEEKELKEIKKKFEKGFREFIDSCKYGITYFNKPTRWNRSIWLVTADSAAKKLEEAFSRFSRYSNTEI